MDADGTNWQLVSPPTSITINIILNIGYMIGVLIGRLMATRLRFPRIGMS